MRRLRLGKLLPALVVLSTHASRADASGLYTYTDLGDFHPYSINAQGDASGYQRVGTGVLYSGYGPNAGRIASIPDASYIQKVNDRGQGIGVTGSGDSILVTPTPAVGGTAGYARVDLKPGDHAYDLDNLGQVVGETYGKHAFLASGGQTTDLGTLGGGYSAALAINAFGQVAGHSTLNQSNTIEHAFLYSGGRMTDLGTLGGSSSLAYAINAAGQVAGISDLAGSGGTLIGTKDDNYYFPSHAFLYGAAKMTDLGTLGGGYSSALSLNASGQVVGRSLTGGGYAHSEMHAFLYADGVMHDLNDLLPAGLGWTLVSANGINDAGQIIGDARDAEGNLRGYLLTPAGMVAPVAPVPEPGTLAVFGLAAVGLGARWASRRLRGRAA